MSTSFNRILAIFKKDFKDLMKNMFISSSMLMPIILAFVYRRVDVIPIEISFLLVNLSFVVVAFLVQCSIIAEEKEKNTLRGLMLSPASVFEIVAGKSALSFLMSSITVLISLIILDYVPGNSFIIITAIIITTIFYIILGTLFGLLTNSVMQASVISLPIMFVFGMGNLVENFAATYNVSFLIEYLPNTQLVTIAQMDASGTTLASVLPHFLVIIGWLVVTSMITLIVFNKKEMNA